MLNSIGLQNPGAHEVVENILPSLEPFETHFIANVSGSTIDEYIEVCRIFDQSNISAIELNISCPNVKKGGMEFGNDPEMSAQVVEACKAETSKPIITKLSPNQADIKESARKCIDAGSDALSVINTITGMAIDIESKRPVLGNTSGGLSGPAIKPIALQKVMQVYEVAGPQNIPIMGQGGISSVEDALEFIIAGASTIGIGTALFIDPLICNKINEGLEKYLVAQGLSSLNELVGSLIKD
jgi:dihydroorotate dehydrogenase (NAD+) catalytic subunit